MDLNRPPVAVFVLIPVLVPVPFFGAPPSSRTQLSRKSKPTCWAAFLAFDGKNQPTEGPQGSVVLGTIPNKTRKTDVSLQAVARVGRCVRCRTPGSYHQAIRTGHSRRFGCPEESQAVFVTKRRGKKFGHARTLSCLTREWLFTSKLEETPLVDV